jgi:hypothetical protein
MRRLAVALSLSLLLALAPSAFAAKKGPHQSPEQKRQAKKNKARTKQYAKRAKASRQRVN